MDPANNLDYQIHQPVALSPSKSPPNSGSHLLPSNSSFPILAVAIIGILATAFLLVSYYVFVIKCCLNWHRIDLLSRFSFSRRRHRGPISLYSPGIQRRGLDESMIRSIPTIEFRQLQKGEFAERYFSECAVCLNEFREEEKLRAIPNCGHLFHVDCIDVWLQSNVNCPLCRTSISISMTHLPSEQLLPPSSFSDQSSISIGCDLFGRDEDYAVIELGTEANSGEVSMAPSIISPQRKLEQPNKVLHRKAKKLSHVSSMGDEWIDTREKDEQFAVLPTRRSISMDSATDRQLYLAVQEILQKQQQEQSSESFSGNRVRRSIFSFGHGRGSKSAVLPVQLEP